MSEWRLIACSREPELTLPPVTFVYEDGYCRRTAELEVLDEEIKKRIAGDRRLDRHYSIGLRLPHDVETRTCYCRNFLKNIEEHRRWADRNLWFIR